ncbi:MAG: hypothetical protein ACFFER_00380 [Candidatus Thorarchaeota archaeon]
MKRLEYKVIGITILFLLCWMGYIPLASRGAVVWSDDFNDGNYDGWTICDNSTHFDGDWGFGGSNWTAANGWLQVESGFEEKGWAIISHPSNVVYGKWSFDFKTEQREAGIIGSVRFISENFHDWDDYESEATLYLVQFTVSVLETGSGMAIALAKSVDGVGTTIDSSESAVPIAGWHHIEVTRTTTGLLSVYHNGSLIVQGVGPEIDTSEMFWLWFSLESMIDNVVVDDAPPTDWLPIAIIGASAVVIVAVLVIILKRR